MNARGRLLQIGQGAPRSNADAGGISSANNYTQPNKQRYVLAHVNLSAPSNTTEVVSALITNPDLRLGCIFSVAFEPDASQAPAPFTPGTFIWTITAMRPGGADGRLARLHTIELNKDLGRAYEVETLVEAFQVDATIGVPVDGSSAPISGNWVLEVKWLPAIPMCESEVKQLYNFCQCIVAQGADLAP